MKTVLLLRTLLLASALAGSAAHAADPQPAPAMPDLAKLMAMLSQLGAETELAIPDEAPAPAAQEPAPPSPAAPQQPASRLATPPLHTSSLTLSSALGGRGPAANVPVTESLWRALFPLKQPRN